MRSAGPGILQQAAFLVNVRVGVVQVSCVLFPVLITLPLQTIAKACQSGGFTFINSSSSLSSS